MKNIDDLVRHNYLGFQSEKSFRENMETYDKLTEQIKTLLEKKKNYDELITRGNDYEDENLSFKDKLSLYEMMDNQVIRKSNDGKDNDYEIILRNKILNLFPDVNEYINLCYRLSNLRETRVKITSEKISFHNFTDDENSNEMCIDKHFLVRFDSELVCLNCGATSKDYDLSKEELDFLTYCAECQGILLKEISKDDLPLFKVLMEEHTRYRNQRTPLDEIDEGSYLTTAEEYYLDDASVLPEIKRQIRVAQLLDTRKYLDRDGLSEEDAKKTYLQLVREGKIKDVGLSEPKYLSDEKLEELQKQLAEKVVSIENSSDNITHSSLLEQCMITKYELAILAGACIPELLAETTTEEEKISLTKAYYNMYSQSGRINSGYFANENEAIFYDCITASPEINRRILQMKLHIK